MKFAERRVLSKGMQGCKMLQPTNSCSATQLTMPKFGSATISSHLNSHQHALAL